MLHTLGVRVAGHSAIYVAGAVLGSMYGIVQLAVLTRVLPVDGFGRLAVLIVYSAFVTMLCNIGFLTGTMLTFPFVHGGGGGIDDEDEEIDEREDSRRPNIDPKRMLGTGMTIALVLTAAITALSAVLAGPLSHALGDPGGGAAVVWATMSGGLGSIWRMLTAVPRYARRPGRYVAMQAGYWAVALGGAAALASAGYGVTGAIAGIALGHAAACAVGMWMARDKFRPRFARGAVGHLGRRGLPYAAITVPGWISRHLDIYVLALYVSHRELALYSVATRFTRIPSLAATGAIFAFGPIARGPMRAALDRPGQNAGDIARGRIVNYYAMLAIWNVIALAIWAPVLVGIVPAGYAHAAVLIPLFAIVAGLHGAQGVLYRMSRFPAKLRALKQIVWGTGILTVGSAFLLAPRYGVYGVMISAAIGPLLAVPYLVVLGQRGPNPLPLGGVRLLGSIAVGLVCIGAARLASTLPHSTEVWADIAITLSFPLLLVAANVIPRAEAARLAGLLPGVWTARRERARIRPALAIVPAADLELVEALVVRGEDPDAVAATLGVRPHVVRRRLVSLLRSFGPGGEPRRMDTRLADILLSSAPRQEREAQGNALAVRGHIDGLELDRLFTLVDELRRLPPDAWRGGSPARLSELSVRPEQLPDPG